MATRNEIIKYNIIVAIPALLIRAPLVLVGMAFTSLGKLCETLADCVPGMKHFPLTPEQAEARRTAAIDRYLQGARRTNAKID